MSSSISSHTCTRVKTLPCNIPLHVSQSIWSKLKYLKSRSVRQTPLNIHKEWYLKIITTTSCRWHCLGRIGSKVLGLMERMRRSPLKVRSRVKIRAKQRLIKCKQIWSHCKIRLKICKPSCIRLMNRQDQVKRLIKAHFQQNRVKIWSFMQQNYQFKDLLDQVIRQVKKS